jgi:hypothetical protein
MVVIMVVIHRITAVSDFSHRPDFNNYRKIIIKIRTMDKVRNPSNSVCYTPSSEPYRIYMVVIVENDTF